MSAAIITRPRHILTNDHYQWLSIGFTGLVAFGSLWYFYHEVQKSKLEIVKLQQEIDSHNNKEAE